MAVSTQLPRKALLVQQELRGLIAPRYAYFAEYRFKYLIETDGDGPVEFELLVADSQGNKLAVDNLKVRLVRERRDYYWNYSDNDGWSYHYNEKFLNLNEETLSLKAGETAKVSFPVEWGPYRVEVEDPQTGLISSLRFWAGYRAQDNAEGGAVRPKSLIAGASTSSR